MIVFVVALAAFVFVVITVRVVVVESVHRRARLEGDLPPGGGEVDGLRDAIEGAIVRLDRLEEERDFYKDLLDLPERRRAISPSAVEDDAAHISTDRRTEGE